MKDLVARSSSTVQIEVGPLASHVSLMVQLRQLDPETKSIYLTGDCTQLVLSKQTY